LNEGVVDIEDDAVGAFDRHDLLRVKDIRPAWRYDACGERATAVVPRIGGPQDLVARGFSNSDKR
jgi:hypothetical protein